MRRIFSLASTTDRCRPSWPAEYPVAISPAHKNPRFSPSTSPCCSLPPSTTLCGAGVSNLPVTGMSESLCITSQCGEWRPMRYGLAPIPAAQTSATTPASPHSHTTFQQPQPLQPHLLHHRRDHESPPPRETCSVRKCWYFDCFFPSSCRGNLVHQALPASTPSSRLPQSLDPRPLPASARDLRFICCLVLLSGTVGILRSGGRLARPLRIYNPSAALCFYLGLLAYFRFGGRLVRPIGIYGLSAASCFRRTVGWTEDFLCVFDREDG